MRLVALGFALAFSSTATAQFVGEEEQREVTTESADPAAPTPQAEPALPQQPAPGTEPAPSQPTPEVEPPIVIETIPAEPEPEVSKPPLGQWRVGGGIGMRFSNNFALVRLAPIVSYIFKNIVEPGVGFVYQWEKDTGFNPDLRSHAYGGAVLLRVYPIPQIFAQIDGELLNVRTRRSGFPTAKDTFGTAFAGGGFVLGVGGSVFTGLSIRVNLNTNRLYPDRFPIFGAGVGVGF